MRLQRVKGLKGNSKRGAIIHWNGDSTIGRHVAEDVRIAEQKRIFCDDLSLEKQLTATCGAALEN